MYICIFTLFIWIKNLCSAVETWGVLVDLLKPKYIPLVHWNIENLQIDASFYCVYDGIRK